MSETRDPPRWLEEPGDLPGVFTREMAAYSASGPSAAQHERMMTALELGVGTNTAPPSSTAGLLKRLGQLSKLRVIGSVMMLTAGASLLYATHHSAEPHSATNKAPPVVASKPLVQEPVEPASPKAEPAVDARSPAMLEAEEVAKPSERKRALAQVRVVPKVATARATVQAASDPVAELSLLARARRVLVASPERALALTAEHAQTYPEGALAEEREVLGIEALMRVQKESEAHARARAFEQAHPHSAHLGRIRVIISSP